MSGSVKLGVIIILAVFAGWLVIKVASALLATIWHLVFPLAVVAGIALIVYGVINRRALTGGRCYLP